MEKPEMHVALRGAKNKDKWTLSVSGELGDAPYRFTECFELLHRDPGDYDLMGSHAQRLRALSTAMKCLAKQIDSALDHNFFLK